MLISKINTNHKVSQTFSGQTKISQRQAEMLRQEASIYPADKFYREKLMLNSGNNPNDFFRLRSIVGAEEMKSIMSKFNDNENFYSVGLNDENIEKKLIRANPHFHTDASDGYMGINDMLTKASNYADEVVSRHPLFKNEPFTIGITDHDVTESAKKAIDIINDNPLKYKNLRTILGVEITTFNNIAPNITKEPTYSHLLVYGIDPNEKTFANFIETTKSKKSNILSLMVDTANKTYNDIFNSKTELFSKVQAEEFFNPLKKNILGIYNYAQKYFETKVILEEIILKNLTITQGLKKNNIELNSNKIMKLLQEQQYQTSRNNAPINPKEIIAELLHDKINIQPEAVKDIIKKGYSTDKFYMFNNALSSNLQEYKITYAPKYDYMPDMKTLNGALKNQKGAIVGIAHPLDTISKIEEPRKQQEFLIDLYTKFKQSFKEKAVFSEVYYQSYGEKIKALKETPQIKELMNKLSRELNLFKTGSADSHRTNIFKRYF